ncbi:hypothetical protein P8452_08794 [Trifolium repens]|nr:hypothetical protein P8452_08794 [Trifolium repens]
MGFQSHNYSRFLNKIVAFDLWTSTIKMDAEDTDLRLCFRNISPSKTYTLQAENELIGWTGYTKLLELSLHFLIFSFFNSLIMVNCN